MATVRESMLAQKRVESVEIEELINLVQQVRPELIGKLSRRRAARLVVATLTQLRRKLGLVHEGTVSVPGLGRFTIRNVQREVKGRTRSMRRTSFKAVAPRGKRTRLPD